MYLKYNVFVEKIASVDFQVDGILLALGQVAERLRHPALVGRLVPLADALDHQLPRQSVHSPPVSVLEFFDHLSLTHASTLRKH